MNRIAPSSLVVRALAAPLTQVSPPRCDSRHHPPVISLGLLRWLLRRKALAGLQQRLEAGQDGRPALGDALEHAAARVESVVQDGELDHLPERLRLERHLGPALRGPRSALLLAEPARLRPLWAERMPGVGEPAARL